MSARFVASSPTAAGLPVTGLAEVAFAGRSNVGKSSLVGLVLRQPRLVRTSRTPGRTQLLNLFVLDERLAIVDLPGYGYAKASKEKRAELSRMIADYLRGRQTLGGVVQLLDARRDEPSELDRTFAAAVLAAERPLLLVATKIDLVPKPARRERLARLARGLGVAGEDVLGCSARTGEGRDELVRELWSIETR